MALHHGRSCLWGVSLKVPPMSGDGQSMVCVEADARSPWESGATLSACGLAVTGTSALPL
jgi:hypothetical protein